MSEAPPVDAQPVRHFQQVYHEHVNKGLFLPLGEAYHFYQWMIANQYWSAAAENYDHVGYWIKRGLIVSRFEYQPFANLSGKSTKTISRYLDRIEELGFGVVLQEGGFIRGTERAPFVVAVGAWHRGPDGARIPHYVGWTNALTGEKGQISVEELAAHVGQLAERGATARKHLEDAREKWGEIREAFINEENAGKTNLSNRENGDISTPGKTNLSSRGKTDLSSRGKTNLSSVNLDSSTQIALTQIEDSDSLRSPGNTPSRKRKLSPEWLAKVKAAEALKEKERKPEAEVPTEAEEEGAADTPPAEPDADLDAEAWAAVRAQAAQQAAPEAPARKKGAKPKSAAPNPMYDAVLASARMTGAKNGTIAKALQAAEVGAEEVAAAAHFIQTRCFVTPQKKIEPGSWTKYLDDYLAYRDSDHAAQDALEAAIGEVVYGGDVPMSGIYDVAQAALTMLTDGLNAEEVLAGAKHLKSTDFRYQGRVIEPRMLVRDLPKWKGGRKSKPKTEQAAAAPETEEVSPEVQARIDAMNARSEAEAAETRRKMGMNR